MLKNIKDIVVNKLKNNKMKTVIIVLILTFIGVSCDIKSADTSGYETYLDATITTNNNPVLSYNKETDDYISELLNKKPDMIEVSDLRPYYDEIWYQIYYYDCKIGVKQILIKPYVNDKEKWTYGAIKRDGETVMIDGGVLDLAEHKVSESTLLRIKNICLQERIKPRQGTE